MAASDHPRSLADIEAELIAAEAAAKMALEATWRRFDSDQDNCQYPPRKAYLSDRLFITVMDLCREADGIRTRLVAELISCRRSKQPGAGPQSPEGRGDGR